MATVDAWGGSWADTWLLHWTYDDTVVVVPPTPGGGGGGAQARSRAGGFWRGGRFYPYLEEPNPFRPEPIKEPVKEIEPEPVTRARVEEPSALADIGRLFKLRAPPAPLDDPEAKPAPRIVKAKTPRTKTPGVDGLADEQPELSLADIELAVERAVTKTLAKHRAENEPEDEEERELRLLRQLGFLH